MFFFYHFFYNVQNSCKTETLLLLLHRLFFDRNPFVRPVATSSLTYDMMRRPVSDGSCLQSHLKWKTEVRLSPFMS